MNITKNARVGFLRSLLSFLFAFLSVAAFTQSLTISPEHRIGYAIFENGDRIPDYSYCGYKASEESIPFVEAKVTVRIADGDATRRIQAAIDHVASLPIDVNGFRGAVQLEPGQYRIDGSLRIDQSGVVLRGSGYDEKGTVLIGTGTGRSALIRIAGENNRVTGDSIPVASEYVPLNATVIPLGRGHQLKAGDKIIVTRPSTQRWIEEIRADKIGIHVDYQLTHWQPGDFDLKWERTVIEATENSVTLDVPLTCALDPRYGGGYINRYQWEGRINKVGVENLRCVSEYDSRNAKDENHRWMAVTVENTEDGWVRRITGEYFVSSIVAVWETARRFTIEDCKCLNPVGEIGAFRRYAFQTSGQQTLFQRCYAEYGYHDFSVGPASAGPNAFVQCYAYHPYEFSGTLGGWSAGTLFDRVTIDGGSLKIVFRDVDGQGGGWSGVNSLCWECRVPQLHLDAPPGAYNWAFGTQGQGYGNGNHEMARKFMKPESFYYAQLEARTGKTSSEKEKVLSVPGATMDQTDFVYAAHMSKRSELPELIMDQWIDTITGRNPLRIDYPEKEITKVPELSAPEKKWPVELINGKIIRDGKPLTGRTQRTALWRGDLRPGTLQKASVQLSRFVPGREGKGLTDNLDSVSVTLHKSGAVALNHFPSLWYERRRDDHGRSRRADADVWAPFYEQPFSRSGTGEAFDRLSKYDLDHFNPWYWSRLAEFARIADRDGLLFIQDHYLQHNIIEEGAHWADYPWRSANNINDLGFPENVYYAGDKRVFMADLFYDTTNERLAAYHKQNIRKHLDDLGSYTNVIHHLGLEYTGPLHFVKFWLDVIDEWQKETGKEVKVMLSATKEVQDTILNDDHYSSLLDIIDIRQWHYCADGSLYAPEGGVSLAQRQYPRIMEEKEDDAEAVFRAVSEYREHYPDKVVVYNYRRSNDRNWGAYLAGASLCDIPQVTLPGFYTDQEQMVPQKVVTVPGKHWGIGKPGTGYLVYSRPGDVSLKLDNDPTGYNVKWFSPVTGEQIGEKEKINTGTILTLDTPGEEDVLMWLYKE